MKQFNRIVVDPFCKRQFVAGATGHIEYDIGQFEKHANQFYQQTELINGYAPFCKHVFVENFAKMLVSTIEITPDNEHLIRTCYEARTEKELPVLKRYFPKESVQLRPCKYLDLILYSKEQIQKQNQAMGGKDPNADLDYDYGIVSVKPSDVPYQTPMDPITMMRNALGKEHGGSGVPLIAQKYQESVQYWKKHALVK